MKQVQKSLRTLRRTIWKSEKEWCEPADRYAPTARKMQITLPDSWKALLGLLPRSMPDPSGGGGGIYIWPAEKLQEKHCEQQTAVERCADEPCQKHAICWFGVDMSGDVYGFTLDSPKMPSDCGVVQWDHESGIVVREWATVPSFVHEGIVALLDRQRSERK